MPKTMLCLIGEQPIPNLLPILHYRPERVLLVHTPLTKKVAVNLAAVLTARSLTITDFCEVSAYDAAGIYGALADRLAGTHGTDLLVNLTGGTKPMMLGAFQFAIARGTASLYFTSEGQLNEIFFFSRTAQPLPPSQPVPMHTTLDIALHAAAFGRMLDVRKEEKGKTHQEALERAVAESLASAVPDHFDEVIPGARFGLVEIDVIVRYRNHIAFCEVYHPDLDKKRARQKPSDKSPIHANLKHKLDQLSTASGRDYFGTYVRKCVIFAGSLENMHPDYQMLSTAQNVHNIALNFPTASETQPLAADEREKLISELSRCLKRGWSSAANA